MITWLLGIEEALAWGPATHLSVSLSALNRLPSIDPGLYIFLSKYLYDYLYGCLSSDIIMGKRFISYKKNCHNWQVGMALLKEATTPGQRAFAYGYLTHLAADTVSHNSYIPSQIILAFSTHTLRHTYWEMRFDAMMDKEMWQLTKSILRQARRRNNPLLMDVLPTHPLSFKTGEKIFNGYLLLGRLERWQRLIRFYSSKSRWSLPPGLVEDYHRRATQVAVDILTQGEGAPCLSLDPMGRESLSWAKNLRRQLRSALKGKRPPASPTSSPLSDPGLFLPPPPSGEGETL